MVVGVPPLAVYVDARLDIARELNRVEAEIAEERARLAKVRLPCLRGEPIDDSARVRLAPVLAAAEGVEDPKAFIKLPWKPDDPLPPGAREYLAKNRELIAPLRSALACTRLEAPSFEMRKEAPSLISWRRLVNLLVAAACERSVAHDDRGCVELLLDCVRLCLETIRADTVAGPQLDASVGNAFAAYCLRLLATFVASGRVEAGLHREIERGLDLIEKALPSAREIWLEHGMARRRELCVTGHMTGLENSSALDDDGRVALTGWSAIVPRTILIARALAEIDAFASAPVLQRTDDLCAPDELVGNVLVRDYTNPYVRLFAFISISNAPRESRTWLAITRGAIVIEDRRRLEGVFPATASCPELPTDPCSRAREPLRYERDADGKGWRLWSVGRNGRDDGGIADSSGEKDDRPLEKR